MGRKKQSKTRNANSKSSQPPIYYLMGSLRQTGEGSKDHAGTDVSAEVWIKARRKDAAIESAKRALAAEGWQFKKIYVASKVMAGFARVGAMMDPPVFTDEEADEWTAQFLIANSTGFACAFTMAE